MTDPDREAFEAAHSAISRALDEAGIKNEVHRGMCLEVGLETFQAALAHTRAQPQLPRNLSEEYERYQQTGELPMAQQGDGDFVPIPQSKEQAELMAKTGLIWLEQNGHAQPQGEPAVPEDTVSNRRVIADDPASAIAIMQRQQRRIAQLEAQPRAYEDASGITVDETRVALRAAAELRRLQAENSELRAEYKKLSALCSSQGLRLMDAEDEAEAAERRCAELEGLRYVTPEDGRAFRAGYRREIDGVVYVDLIPADSPLGDLRDRELDPDRVPPAPCYDIPV